MKKGQNIKMGNQKGFTLIELIAVIVVLSLITTLAVVSVASIRNKVNERHYNSLVKTIESAAQSYAEETGITKMYVQTLIDKGLVQTEDETRQIYDPRDNSVLNCRIIKYENGIATLTSEKNTSCDASFLSDQAIKIQYYINSDPTEKKDFVSGAVIHETITLTVVSTGLININFTGATYRWVVPTSPDKIYNSKELVISQNNVNDTYKVIVTVGGKSYTAYADVKIIK